MKNSLTLLLLGICYGAVSAQTNVFPPTGNVGVGTLDPAAKISFNNVNDGADTPDGITWNNAAPLVYGIYRTPGTWVAPAYQQLKLSWDTGIILEPGSSYQNSYVDIKGGGLRVTSGNLGIGVVNPSSPLQVEGAPMQSWLVNLGNTGATGHKMYFGYGNSTGTNYGLLVTGGRNLAGQLDFAVENKFYVMGNGSVLIGKTTQANSSYLLDVNGKARANEIVVNTTGADFVFEPDYKLTDLTELEKFVKTHKHLPEIPTAKQMIENGVNLGELNIKLLQKVEELTLHLIELSKKVEAQEAYIKTLNKKVE
ncbi:hypothetical protein QFZ20_002215 [Flavobacterium sp. W4I14]|nr:hypothetical protein [Flavobacterium sp. W4I14]